MSAGAKLALGVNERARLSPSFSVDVPQTADSNSATARASVFAHVKHHTGMREASVTQTGCVKYCSCAGLQLERVKRLKDALFQSEYQKGTKGRYEQCLEMDTLVLQVVLHFPIKTVLRFIGIDDNKLNRP